MMCPPREVLVFRCAACGATRRITRDGFKELREAGEWRCTLCGGTSLELRQ
jgi:DNA-directed RNA polymerase subunit RPC12/RpoP